MNKSLGYFLNAIGCIFILMTLYVSVGNLLWISSNDKDINGVGVLANVIIPQVVVMGSISFLSIKYGLQLIKKKKPEEKVPPT